LDARSDAYDKTGSVAPGILIERLQHAANQLGFAGSIQLIPSTIHRDREAFIVQGFEQVVEGAHFKGSQRVFLVRGEKNDVGQIVCRQCSNDIEAIDLRHLNIEEYEVRFQ